MKRRLEAASQNLEALDYAQEIQQLAAEVGFDWDDVQPAFDKLQEEIEELKESFVQKNPEHIQEEMGDVFFAMVNVSRLLGYASSELLTKASEKFKERFAYIEDRLVQKGKGFEECDLTELDEYWNEAKVALKK